MTIVLDGTTGITTPGEAISGNLSYTGTLTGGTGVVNLGSGQVYKDASGNVGIGTSSPTETFFVNGNTAISGTGYASFQRALIPSGAGSGTPSLQFRLITDGSTYTAGSAIDMLSDGVWTSTSAPGILRFRTTASGSTTLSERARIDSSGRLLLNQTANNGTALMQMVTPASTNGILVQIGTNGGNAMSFLNSGGAAGVGSITVNVATTAYNTSSDYRLKEAIAPMTGALAKVALLKPVTYKWKVDGSDGQGFIAHELAEVEAGCVTGAKDAVDEEGNPQYQGIDTSFLIATLSAAIQELHALVKTQDSTITALNERLTALEAPIV